MAGNTQEVTGVEEIEIHPTSAMPGDSGMDGLLEVMVYGDEHVHVPADSIEGDGGHVRFGDPQSQYSEVYSSITFDEPVTVTVDGKEVTYGGAE